PLSHFHMSCSCRPGRSFLPSHPPPVAVSPWAFSHNLHAAIRFMCGPACQPQFPCARTSPPPKSNALDISTDEGSHAFHESLLFLCFKIIQTTTGYRI